MLTVVYSNEQGERQQTPLAPGKVITVGRGKDRDVRVVHTSVSRAHAEFYEVDSAWCVRDVGSSNHTFLNGEKTELAYVQVGDRIRFGDYEVSLELIPQRLATPSRASVRPEPVAPEPAAPPELARPPAPASAAEPPADAGVPGRRVRPSAMPQPEAPQPVRAPGRLEPREVEATASRPRRPDPEVVAEPSPRRPSVAPEPESPPRRPEVAPEPQARRPQIAPEPEAPPRRPPVQVEQAPPRRVEPTPAAPAAPEVPPRRAAPEASRAPVAGIDPATYRAEQERANRLEEQLKEQRQKTEHALARIRELEQRQGGIDEEQRDWEARYDRAREQSTHVQGLLERARDEVRNRDETIDGLEREVGDLRGAVRQFEATRDQSAEQLADLKSKAVQKDRRIDELQRELDMMEFDLRNARDELESVQNSINFENTETRKLEREQLLLREVIHEKENHIKSLQIEIEERDKEIYDLKLGTGVKDLQVAKTEMMEKYFAKDKEANELRERVAKLEQQLRSAQGELEDASARLTEARDLANHPDFKRKERELQRAVEDAEQLRGELAKSQERLAEFGPELKARLESEAQQLVRKVTTLEERLTAAEGQSAGRVRVDAELATANRRVVSLESQLTELKGELSDARKALRERGTGAGSPPAGEDRAAEVAALGRKVSELEARTGELSAELTRARDDAERSRGDAERLRAELESARSLSASTLDKDGALDSIDAMMDLYRSWKSNLDVLKTYGDDISAASGNLKAIGDAVDGIGQTLTSVERDAEDMRNELKSLRHVIEKG